MGAPGPHDETTLASTSVPSNASAETRRASQSGASHSGWLSSSHPSDGCFDSGTILAERFVMYRELREETRQAGMPEGNAEFYDAYARLVALVQARVLGGARFSAVKDTLPQ